MKAEPVRSLYYSEEILDNTRDLNINLFNLLITHYSFDSMLRTTNSLMKQILACSVVLEKYFVFLQLFKNTGNPLVSDMVASDVECLFGNIRILFDEIQYIIRELAS